MLLQLFMLQMSCYIICLTYIYDADLCNHTYSLVNYLLYYIACDGEHVKWNFIINFIIGYQIAQNAILIII